MKNKFTVSILVLFIAAVAIIATLAGITSSGGPGPFWHDTVRGATIAIYGKGIYQHMSAEVAPQGIAQDYVTLFLAVPLLLVSMFFARGGSLVSRFLLAGTLLYFVLTYLFYLVMCTYNVMFLGYAMLLSASFFALSLTILSFNKKRLKAAFNASTPVKTLGAFLILVTFSIALLWLSVVVTPLLDGSIIPLQVDHYTTLVVQGLDLSLFLPIGFVAGLLLIQEKKIGYLLAPVYFVFLSLLMTALSVKIYTMGMLGFSIEPAVYIIPTINVLTIVATALLLYNVQLKKVRTTKKVQQHYSGREHAMSA
ncbi:hypothetical protein FVR03_16125 [Pontibacter qinzhouensis]|uniref:Uncharacterized protein n=1 Tax=Pontibacter qinzhouensis TaxID=2603253 RepID=A0A5C8JK93_9BACT|nr:hypothetical protein [Pontibacter qinzhouensis]TXK37007.1 hypothetical protein FVR03_16125 [Pontibacter qinzhouensis]